MATEMFLLRGDGVVVYDWNFCLLYLTIRPKDLAEILIENFTRSICFGSVKTLYSAEF